MLPHRETHGAHSGIIVRTRGVRGGAICDYLRLVAARKAGAKRFYALNLSDFLSFHRPGDPEILSP